MNKNLIPTLALTAALGGSGCAGPGVLQRLGAEHPGMTPEGTLVHCEPIREGLGVS